MNKLYSLIYNEFYVNILKVFFVYWLILLIIFLIPLNFFFKIYLIPIINILFIIFRNSYYEIKIFIIMSSICLLNYLLAVLNISLDSTYILPVNQEVA